MLWQKSLIHTLKEDPKEAEGLSHKLLLRAGFIRQHQSGVYTFLPPGWRVIKKIIAIVREEMDKIGAQELLFPSLTSSQLWKESGRWESFGDDMFKLKDRKNREMALAPTHEELIADLARATIRSYRDLPQIWYQIQTKFRDEPRPKGGLLRVREFFMKDSYSLDSSWEGLDENYEKHKNAYEAIFKRAGLNTQIVSASSGLMGGSKSEEFMVLSPSGEDEIALCPKCGYKANVEVAEAKPLKPNSETKFKKLEKVYTPGVKSVEEVSQFLGVSPANIVKNILFFAGGKSILVLIRGDYEIQEEKIKKVIGPDAHLADPEEVKERFGVTVGFLGPLNLPVDEIIADPSVNSIEYAVVGANEDEHHLVGVSLKKDIKISRFADVRKVKSGDLCVRCGSPIETKKAIEVGHIFKLGTRYSESLEALFADQNGALKPIIMGSYGIGIGRIMSAAVEQFHDEGGIIWPIGISPFDIEILEINPEKTREISLKIYNEFRATDIEVIWDNRDVSPGVKFKDADLIGIPFRLVIGEKKAKQGLVEFQLRKDNKNFDIPLKETKIKVLSILEEEKNV